MGHPVQYFDTGTQLQQWTVTARIICDWIGNNHGIDKAPRTKIISPILECELSKLNKYFKIAKMEDGGRGQEDRPGWEESREGGGINESVRR